MAACESHYDNLEGHWHVYEDPPDSVAILLSDHVGFDELGWSRRDSCENIFGYYQILDISDNMSPIWGKGILGREGTGGWLDEKEKSIRIGGECFEYSFKYELKDDTLFLNDLKEKQYTALKVGCCDRQKDFFVEQPVEIDLPIIQGTNDCIRLSETDRIHGCPIFIGELKANFNCYSIPIRLAIDDRFASVGDAIALIKLHKEMVPPNSRDQNYPVIYSNSITDTVILKKILMNLHSEGQHNVFFAFREKGKVDELNVWLKPVRIDTLVLGHFFKDYYEEYGKIRIEIEEPRNN